MQRHALALCSPALLLLSACVGNPLVLGVGEESAESGGGSSAADDGGFTEDGDGPVSADGPQDDDAGETTDTGPAPACPVPDTYGATFLGPTLTTAQYVATVRDLTGTDIDFAPADLEYVGPFSLGVGTGELALLIGVQVAEAVDLAAVLPCDPALVDADAQQECYDVFTPAFARLAWRRPVGPDDLQAQAAAFAGAGEFATRMRAVIASVLADERFLTIATTGTPTAEDPGLVELDAHALATRLSMFLWSSGPDDELLDLADSGALLEPATLHAQAERLLADPRAARFVDDFHAQWLGLGRLPSLVKDPATFPEFNEQLGADMLTGTLTFVRAEVLDGDARLADLFTSPTTWANANVASILQSDIVGPIPQGPQFEPVELDPERRGGLLTEPGFAAQHAHPTGLSFALRGLIIRENLLCETVPPPPPDIDFDPADIPVDAPRKEIWQAVFGDPECAVCHNLFDPFGFAFDNYDALGRWTSQIDGYPIDTSGQSGEFEFTGRAELVDQLLASEELPACVVRQYVRYALDRDPTPADTCTLEALEQTLADSDGNVRALALAIVDSDAFRYVRNE